MIFAEFDYITLPALCGNLREDVGALLCANGKETTFTHVCAVAEQNKVLAARLGLDAEKCAAAGLLHDVSSVIRAEDMLVYAQRHGLSLCAAEERFPFLLHQRLSEIAAREWFKVTDADILSPIAVHSTLKAGANTYKMALFLADKLAWDQDGAPPFRDAVTAALEISPQAACLAYMDYMESAGRVLYPHEDWVRAESWLRGE
ncbi:MAG: HD domain-containing protein [Oscillospiraceae bacterium]